MVRRHLIAIDGKKQAELAFNWYLNNINRPGDEVVIFYCSQFVVSVGLPGAAVNVEAVQKEVTAAQQKCEKITGQANDVLKLKGIKGYSVIKTGMKPDEGILEACAEHDCDHIIMGTRDLNSLQRALVGSVSTSVARHAKVPVTIVKVED